MFLCSVRAPFGGKMGSAITPAPNWVVGLQTHLKKLPHLVGLLGRPLTRKRRGRNSNKDANIGGRMAL